MSNLLIAPNRQTSNLLISVGRTRSWSNVLPRGPSREWREKLLNRRKDKDGAQFLCELRDWIVWACLCFQSLGWTRRTRKHFCVGRKNSETQVPRRMPAHQKMSKCSCFLSRSFEVTLPFLSMSRKDGQRLPWMRWQCTQSEDRCLEDALQRKRHHVCEGETRFYSSWCISTERWRFSVAAVWYSST